MSFIAVTQSLRVFLEAHFLAFQLHRALSELISGL